MVQLKLRRMEFLCFRMPLQYSWSRKDKPFPKGTTFRYDNRVMTIPKAQFEDGGTYTCQVVKLTGKQNIVSKSIVLVLEGMTDLNNLNIY